MYLKWIFCLSSIFAVAVLAAEPVRSSLQVGEKIFATFEPLNVTGTHAGEPHCLVCENGLNPVAMVFARELNEPLVKLLKELEEATAKHQAASLGSFAVFLGDAEKLTPPLTEAAEKHGLKRVILSIDQPAGPDGFKVSSEAEVTVVLYHKYDVLANHAFRPGQLDAKAIERVMADLPKILPK